MAGAATAFTYTALLLVGAPVNIQFTDVAAAAGIQFVHSKGAHGSATILEEAGPGVCVVDFNSDGWQDLYFVNGRDRNGGTPTSRNALYRNKRDGTFEDVTEKAGVPGTAYGLGCVSGDYDNDGHADLYVTQYGKNVLYHNNGDGTFTDVTAKAHVDGMDFGAKFHTGATFFDYDRDGFLDLYAGSYVEFGPESKQTCSIGFGLEASCPPSQYRGSPAVLYHNNGDGTFTNVTKKAGMFQPKGKNLSVGAFDYDNDGWPDLFVANDGVEAYLYHNERNGTFKDIASTSGIALTESGATMAAMCISLGDYDNDGLLDLYISDFQDVPDHIWHNDGHGFFEEVSERSGIAGTTKRVLSFGGGWLDFDNDGRLDLFIANGHVYQGIEKVMPAVRYKQINSLFHNTGGGRFAEVTSNSGDGFKVPHLGRGAAFVDIDNDGNLDVVVANSEDPPLVLRNSGGSGNHFLNLKLVGTRSNRDALGARLTLRAGGITEIREISAGGSYLSHSDLRAHFGMGQATKADSIEIRWPNGDRQLLRDIDCDQFLTVTQPAMPLPSTQVR